LSTSFEQHRNDWQLKPRWFHYLDEAYGQHTVDRFAVRALWRRWKGFYQDINAMPEDPSVSEHFLA
jgi:hypothetical protein